MFNIIKKMLGVEDSGKVLPTPTIEPSISEVKEPIKKKKIELTPKEKATQAGEPYVAILNVDLDPSDINNGAFELDWNDKFIINLIKQGYKYKKDDTDQMVVDRWFQQVCRNIALEIYEQEIADPDKRDDIRIIQQRNIGGGFTEVS
jgi:hypothetical protein